MTTVLTREEIFLPTTRRPNKVIPVAVDPSEDQPYVIGRPRFSVQDWTPPDHYAGPAPIETAATQAFSRHGPKPTHVPILRPPVRGMTRDFYAPKPANFYPCTRKRMDAIGVNRTLKVNPTFRGLDGAAGDGLKTAAVAVGAGVLTYFVARRILRGR